MNIDLKFGRFLATTALALSAGLSKVGNMGKFSAGASAPDQVWRFCHQIAYCVILVGTPWAHAAPPTVASTYVYGEPGYMGPGQRWVTTAQAACIAHAKNWTDSGAPATCLSANSEPVPPAYQRNQFGEYYRMIRNDQPTYELIFYPIPYAICPDSTSPSAVFFLECPMPSAQAPRSCEGLVGNPIDSATGTKVQHELDYRGPGVWALSIERLYNQNIPLGATTSIPPVTSNDAAFILDGAWTTIKAFFYGHWWTSRSAIHNGWHTGYERSVKTGGYPSGTAATLQRANGDSYFFGGANAESTWTKRSNIQHRLARVAAGWRLADPKAHTFETYDEAGRLVSIAHRAGTTQFFGYNAAGRLASVTDSFGRSLGFSYDVPGRLAGATDPSGASYTYGYDSLNRLISVLYPDTRQKSYLYELGAFPNRLTGIIDEKGARYATFGYDEQGRAISTEHAGGVERVSLSYDANNAYVTDSLQQQRTYGYTNLVDWPDTRLLTSRSQPAGSGCAASTRGLSYDTAGNRTSQLSFSGVRSCYAHDIARKLETVHVAGLEATANCANVTPANAALPTGSRKTSTEWHPDWQLATRTAEPGRIETNVYNGQPDPFNGGAVASCAPTSALLPDGKPIAVLCKRVEEATTDVNGAAGFAAVLHSGVPNRVTKWTYNQWGQVLSENGPRTDVNDTTVYTYYSDTVFTGEGAAAQGHYMGDLATVTNAAGKVTQYTKYNKHGQMLESVDPNGVVTTQTYDLRQRILSSTIGTQTPAYQYDPVGQLKRVTLPDQSWIGYDYDDAHRQVAVYDHKGNRTEYQLDNAGNRTGEQVKDPGGALKRQLSRSIDALGRVQQTTGRE